MEFDNIAALVTGFRGAIEKHGEQDVEAADIHLVAPLGNEALDLLEPGLRRAIYHFDRAADPDLIDQSRSGETDYLPHLKFHNMLNIFKFGIEYRQATLVLNNRLPGRLVEIDGTANGFVAECFDGGIIKVSLKFRCHPAASEAGAIYMMNGKQVAASLSKKNDPQEKIMEK